MERNFAQQHPLVLRIETNTPICIRTVVTATVSALYSFESARAYRIDRA
jgi:hypothetical protein